MAPRFEVDPLWPKPLPNHWVLGQVIGLTDRPAGSRLDRASRQPARRQRSRRQPESADRLLLRKGAAGARIRSRRHRRRPLGRAGRGLRLARVESRHHDRSQGQRLDRRQRRHRRAPPEVHQGRQVPDAVRQARPEQGQQRHRELRPAGEDLHRREGQRGLHRRRLRQQARRRHRRRHRQVQALLGRVRQQAGRHQLRQLRSESAADQAVPHARALRGTLQRRARLRVRSGRTTASRSSSRTARS